MKRKFIVVFGLLILLSGCSKSNKSELGTPENPYKIVWYNFASEMKDMDLVLDKVNEYTREKIGVELDMKVSLGDYNQQMQVKMASGEAFDICFTSSWANDYKSAVDRGYLIEIDDLLDDYGQDIIEVLDPLFLEGTKINGKNYGLPINREMAYQHVFLFNKKYIDKYNIDLENSVSWEKLNEIFQLINEKEPGITTFYPWSYYLMQDQDYIINANIPGCVLIDDGKPEVINQYKTENFVNQMKWYHKFYKQGYIPNDAVIDGNALNLKAGNWFCTIHAYGPAGDSAIEEECGFPVECVPMFQKPIIGNTSLLGALVGISSTSERPDLVMKFLNLVNSDPYLRNLLGFGIEGIHYKKVTENRIELLPDSKNYKMSNYNWTIGNLFICYLLPEDPDNKWELFEEWNKSAVLSPIAGFSFDSNSVKTEMTAINNISKEYSKSLFMGSYDPDIYIDKMLNRMKKAGLDKVMTEMQIQLVKWWDDYK